LLSLYPYEFYGRRQHKINFWLENQAIATNQKFIAARAG
jgi:hypothetical protein